MKIKLFREDWIVIIVLLLALVFVVTLMIVDTGEATEKTKAKVEETTPVTEPIIEETTEPTIEEVEVIEPPEPIKNYLGEFVLTAYCACVKCCGKTDGITATGTKATDGRTIAVDPSVIPYGSKVSINGNIYVAEDCGGAVNNNHIDIYFDSHDEALQFGVQYSDVYLVS